MNSHASQKSCHMFSTLHPEINDCLDSWKHMLWEIMSVSKITLISHNLWKLNVILTCIGHYAIQQWPKVILTKKSYWLPIHQFLSPGQWIFDDSNASRTFLSRELSILSKAVRFFIPAMSHTVNMHLFDYYQYWNIPLPRTSKALFCDSTDLCRPLFQ